MRKRKRILRLIFGHTEATLSYIKRISQRAMKILYLELPQNLNILVSLDDNVELESWSDGERKAKLWRNINVELVLLFVGLQSINSIEILGISLVEMGIREGYGSSLR